MPILANNDFTGSELTAIINDVQQPQQPLQSLGLFDAKGLRTTGIKVERKAQGLQLVQTSARGSSSGTDMNHATRDMVTFESVRLMVKDTLQPADIQNIRQFAADDDELIEVRAELAERAQRMRDTLDANLERMRFGAIKGQVLDADGSVIFDMFQKFGYTQTKKAIQFGTGGNLEAQVLAAKNAADKATTGKLRKGYMALCGAGFTDKLHTDDEFKRAYDRYQDSAQARTDMRDRIAYKNIDWIKCDDGIGSELYIPEDKAYLFPVIPQMFIERYTPGDIMWAVNQRGLPFYMTQEDLKHDMGVEIWGRSFPIILNTIPQGVIELSISA